MPDFTRRLCMVIVAALLLMGGTAHAHRLNIFATGDGTAISGYAYFPGGGRAQGLTITAEAPDGSPLGSALTDERGEFTIPAKLHCDHILTVQTPDGHRAVFTVPASELDDSLPTPGMDGPAGPAGVPVAGEAVTMSQLPATGSDELSALIEEAVRREVRSLREQLEGYEERVRLRDVLGGIGYILGIAGIASYLMGRRRRGPGAGETRG
jgi:nickel transport protein